MFDVIFGWRKASECKKLLRRVQCRLKLLKNKTSSILRHSRDDVAQLLRFGHDQNAFSRTEHIIKDESILAVYDLLEAFCEFIIINLPYIRKHRDCPNDINEAVSTLVFASARCGDLPELRKLRILFGNRYGHKTTKIALELLPGNLVNQTIKENLSMRSVPNDAKYKLMDEIASSLQVEPLALEYTSEQQQLETTNPESHSLTKLQESQSSESETIPESGIYGRHSDYGDSDLQASDVSKDEGNEAGHKEPFLTERHMEGDIIEDSTSEISSDQKPEKIVYLDDIEEFKFPICKDGCSIQDQRLFLFKSSDSTKKKYEVWYDGDIELYSSMDKKASSKGYIKSGKADGNKLRKRLHSGKNRNANDVESAIYYGILMNLNHKSYDRRDHPKKMQKKDSPKLLNSADQHSENIVNNCSLENPCYLCVGNDRDDSESVALQHKRRIATVEHSHGIYNNPSACNGVTIAKPETVRKEKMFVDHIPHKHTSQVEQEAKSVSTLISQKETQHFYLRATTLPSKRPKDDQAGSILQSNSFPFQQPTDHWSNAPRSPRIHPNLPNYDELAEQFMALKKATLQKQHQRRKW